MTPKRCCGINSYGSGGSKIGDRCKVKVKDAYRLQRCLNANKDMCYMHCDCSYCSENYQKTANRGKRHSSAESQIEKKNNLVSSKKLDRNIIPQFLLDEKDIEKLRDVCITVYMNYHHQWDNIIRLSQKRNKNREALSKINELQLQINKLRKELE